MLRIGDSRSEATTTPTGHEDADGTPIDEVNPPVGGDGGGNALAPPTTTPAPSTALVDANAPMSKQRLGAYKNFARTANRTLTTFTNEMSEILRQSVERLDSISMKVRGCVYEIEKQRVAMPLAAASQLADIFEGNEHEPTATTVEKFKVLVEDRLGRAPLMSPVSISTRELPAGGGGGVGGSGGGVVMQENSVTDTMESTCGKLPGTRILETPLLKQSEIRLIQEKENMPEEVVPSPVKPATPSARKKVSTPQKLTRQISTSKKVAASNEEPTTPAKVDEREVIQRINRQHKQKRGVSKESTKAPRGDKPQKKVDRKRRKRGDATAPKVTTTKTPPPVSKKSSRHSTTSNVHKSVTSNKSVHMANAVHPTPPKMEMKNTKLARKFASSNFHDTSSVSGGRDGGAPRVDSYTGGRVVRLMSDSRQDWSVIMHTQKAPNRFELRQPSPQPILDDITLKDLEPLKAEYPRRDHIIDYSQRVEDSPLFKLVNGSATSMECLIDVACNVRKGGAHTTLTAAGMKKRSSTPTPVTPTMMVAPLPSAINVGPASSMHGTRLKTAPSAKQMQGQVMSSIIQAQGKGDAASVPRGKLHPASMARAGILRTAQEGGGGAQTSAGNSGKKPINVKASVIEQSKRIAMKLAEMRNERPPAHSPEQIYKQGGEKDAKRRLKKYIGNPSKTHQKYMVMMIYDIVYDHVLPVPTNILPTTTVQPQSRPSNQAVADFLAKYIYLDDSQCRPQIPQPTPEYTVAIMISQSDAAHSARVAPPTATQPIVKPFMSEQVRNYAISRDVKPTRDTDSRVNRSTGNHHHRLGESTLTPRIVGGAGIVTRNGGESSWKNAIRSCYYQQPSAAGSQPSQHGHQHPTQKTRPLSTTPPSHKPMDSLQVKGIISNMEIQLKQVMNNPHIENKAVVIKGLQEQMEWILSTLEGQSTALRKRRDISKRPAEPKFRRTNIEKREPILKPVELPVLKNRVLPSISADSAATGTSLKKTTATTVIPDETISEEIQNQLMSKWQSLEHPSNESVLDEKFSSPASAESPSSPKTEGTDNLSTSLPREPIVNMEEAHALALPPATHSRPETRRDGRPGSHPNPTARANNDRYQSQYEGSYLREGKKGQEENDRMLEEILNKLHKDDQKLLDEESESFFNSCCADVDESPVKDEGRKPKKSKVKKEHVGGDRATGDRGDVLRYGLTAEEIAQFQENIKILECQLGEETQRFVDEMDEVIKEIQSSETSKSSHGGILMSTIRKLQQEDDITDPTDTTKPSITTSTGTTSTPSQGLSVPFAVSPVYDESLDPSTKTSTEHSEAIGYVTTIGYITHKASVTSTCSELMHVAEGVEAIQVGPPLRIPISSNIKMEVELLDQGTECTAITQPSLLLSPAEITLTLNHDMRRSIRRTDGCSSKESQLSGEKKQRDYDLTATTSASPMMEDIRKNLFKEKEKVKEPEKDRESAILPSLSTMLSPFRRKSKLPRCFNRAQRSFHRMPWEMTDKSTTTLSLTNLDDFLIVDGPKPEQVCQAMNTSAGELAHRSKSELTLYNNVVEVEEPARVAKLVTRFFANTGLTAMSESVESILSATLTATLARQHTGSVEPQLPPTKEIAPVTNSPSVTAAAMGKDCCRVVRDFGVLLMFVYSAMFAVIFCCLNWCPRCITG